MNKRLLAIASLLAVVCSLVDQPEVEARRRGGGFRSRPFIGRSYRAPKMHRARRSTNRGYTPVSYKASASTPGANTPAYRKPKKPDYRPVSASASTPGANDWKQNRRTPGYMEKGEVASFILKGQTQQSLRKRYGQPARTDGNQDIWDIAGTSDGVMAPGRMIVTYGDDKKAVSAYDFNNR